MYIWEFLKIWESSDGRNGHHGTKTQNQITVWARVKTLGKARDQDGGRVSTWASGREKLTQVLKQ